MTLYFLRLPVFFQVFAIFVCFITINYFGETRNVQAESFEPKIFKSLGQIPIETKSQFVTKTSQKKQAIPFTTVYYKDPNLEWGKVAKSQKGVVGESLIVTETLFWKGKEIGERTYLKQVSPPQVQINLIGTKLTPGVVNTPKGELAYRGKMRVFATSYDKNCTGCNETTATGAKLTFGIAAVDPAFIPLGSKIYVQGYGEAIAADTGGAIKGAKIDLAFDDVKNGFWRSRWTDIYLLE